MQETTMTKQQSQTTVKESTSVEAEVSKLGALSIAAFGAAIGLWSVACIVSAMVQAGGPLQLVGSWFKAVSGL